jgi:hypothetical protein
MQRRINELNDALIGAGVPVQNGTLLDFWKWAYSDLCDDGIKGEFAEWLVHKLLDVPSARRVSWANSDLITASGIGIEVKAAAYWQSWKLIDGHGTPYPQPISRGPLDETKIRFGGLMARDSTTVPDHAAPRTLKSQIYVFAFQHEKDIARWNAMELSQWEFYVVKAEELAKIGGRSISLRKLKPLYGPLDAAEFVTRTRLLIKHLEQVEKAP